MPTVVLEKHEARALAHLARRRKVPVEAVVRELLAEGLRREAERPAEAERERQEVPAC